MPDLNTSVCEPQAKPPEHFVPQQSFEELFAEYYPLVYGVALKFAGQPEDAEDIAQEVFTKVWQNLEAFNYNSSFKTWIYRIAINACIDFSRKPWKRYAKRNTAMEDVFADGTENSLQSDQETAEVSLLAQEKAERVRRAIAKLKPHLKAVLVLKDLEEMTYEEISSVMGLSMGTISSRLNRARKALQAALGSVAPALLYES